MHVRTIDPATKIPPTGLLLHRKHYAIPYIYSDDEITRLLTAAAALTPERRAMLHSTVIGLLAVTGMRISEALHLDCEDVDLEIGVLTIRDTKFGKSRQVPLHPSTVEALARYERHAKSCGRGRGRRASSLPLAATARTRATARRSSGNSRSAAAWGPTRRHQCSHLLRQTDGWSGEPGLIGLPCMGSGTPSSSSNRLPRHSDGHVRDLGARDFLVVHPVIPCLRALVGFPIQIEREAIHER